MAIDRLSGILAEFDSLAPADRASVLRLLDSEERNIIQQAPRSPNRDTSSLHSAWMAELLVGKNQAVTPAALAAIRGIPAGKGKSAQERERSRFDIIQDNVSAMGALA